MTHWTPRKRHLGGGLRGASFPFLPPSFPGPLRWREPKSEVDGRGDVPLMSPARVLAPRPVPHLIIHP